MLEIKKGNNNFYIGESEDNPLAKLSIENTSEDVVTVDIVHLDESLKGHGVGKAFLKELADWARKENKKIISLCPYIRGQMEKNREYHDLIYKKSKINE